MEHETLFTASKWQLLKQLERGPHSPLELAKLCKTSIANVSQQLRLLEMAGLVKTQRIPNRDKDKPRVLYSLAGNLSYVIATSGQFVEKKLLPLTDLNKIVMRIWFFEKPELQYTIEKAFWKIEEHLDKITLLAVDKTHTAPLTFFMQFTGKPFALAPFTVTDQHGTTRQIVFSTTLPERDRLYILHDPRDTVSEKAQKTGGRQ